MSCATRILMMSLTQFVRSLLMAYVCVKLQGNEKLSISSEDKCGMNWSVQSNSTIWPPILPYVNFSWLLNGMIKWFINTLIYLISFRTFVSPPTIYVNSIESRILVLKTCMWGVLLINVVVYKSMVVVISAPQKLLVPRMKREIQELPLWIWIWIKPEINSKCFAWHSLFALCKSIKVQKKKISVTKRESTVFCYLFQQTACNAV